ncbi:uncharacterized protein LOC135498896 [Lineus longissimus]|uniref:uncharacterized protein LOC135498896 n=1 Tax=Lineus longissimus TaxID=88925 RepID=UPI002B4E6145
MKVIGEVLDDGMIHVLPCCDGNGCCVIILRPRYWDLLEKRYPLYDVMRPMLMVLEKLVQTPTSFTRPEQVVLLCTGLKCLEQMKVQKCASMLHGRIFTEFPPEVSHVHSEGMCARTLKYLNAVLLGKWILN